MEMHEKLEKLQEDFRKDQKAQDLITQLKTRFNELQEQVFTSEDFESNEFNEMNEEYYSVVREGDVDAMELFDFFWFK